MRSFLSQKTDGKMIFTDYWKVLVLNSLEMGNTVFFWAKKLKERRYLLITERLLFWITERFLFWTFRRWETQYFLSQKVDEKIIFTWYFWAFDDIPGLGKYGFSWSESSAGEVIVSDSGKCNFREAFIVPTIGLFHGIYFCTQWTVSLSLSFIRSTCAIRIKSMCSKNEITKVDMYMQIELQKMVSNISILSLKRFGYFFSSHWRNCF